jgi:hypothetical protein
VRYPYIHAFTQKSLMQWIAQSSAVSVNIAIHGHKGFYFFNGIRHAEVANVSRMPNLVGFRQQF